MCHALTPGGALLSRSPQAAPGGRALSFLWWITSFQLFGILLSAAAHFKPSLRIGSAALLAVLTASTFAYTYDVYSDSLGIFALTHNSSLDSFVPTKDNMPGRLYSFYKGAPLGGEPLRRRTSIRRCCWAFMGRGETFFLLDAFPAARGSAAAAITSTRSEIKEMRERIVPFFAATRVPAAARPPARPLR